MSSKRKNSNEAVEKNINTSHISTEPVQPNSPFTNHRISFTAQDLIKESIKEIEQSKKFYHWSRYIKLAILLVCWTLCCVGLVSKTEGVSSMHQISVPSHRQSLGYIISQLKFNEKQLTLHLQGALLPSAYGNLSQYWLAVWVELIDLNYIPKDISNIGYDAVSNIENVTEEWRVPIASPDLIGLVPETKKHKVFEFDTEKFATKLKNSSWVRIKFRTNLRNVFPLSFSYHLSTIGIEEGVFYGALLLFGLYILIIFEIIHRTLAAMLASTMAVAILAALNDKPSMKIIISWIDAETLLLLFSMMMLVAIFSETGIFDYIAVTVFQITNGQIWPLITTLCLCTSVLSSFLDNVTTILLITPITIRLCEVMELNPKKVLMMIVMFSNIGGAITPIGDPPNVIIVSNPAVMRSGVNFVTFFIHMGIGVTLSMIVVYIHLRIKFRNINDLKTLEPREVQDLRHNLVIWQSATTSVTHYMSVDKYENENLFTRTRRFLIELRMKLTESNNITSEKYKETLKELKEKYPIRDHALLIQSAISLFMVIVVFFLHSLPVFEPLGLGWTALLGVMLLLLLADRDNIESVLARIEWSTLLFFASLFILMEALSKLGLIDWIGNQTEAIILSVDKESRLAVAILLILWVSAAASAFVDNIPLTTMMVKIATAISEDRELSLPLQPLIWALSFGACLGGNGTLFGSSANIICAGVAEQHGYKITFIDFLKLGFPIMLVSMVVITAYLMVAHVLLGWNS